MKILMVIPILFLALNLAYAEDFRCADINKEEFLEAWFQELSIEKQPHHTQEWKDDFLKEKGLKAVQHYTEIDYLDINRGLRDGNLRALYINKMKFICVGLTYLPLFQGKSFRLARLSGPVINYYLENVGKVITEKSFLSSASARIGARLYAFSVRLEPNIQFIIKSKNGRSIKSVSYSSHEFEVLYPAGSKFLITKVKHAEDETDLYKVWMTQVE